MLPRILIQCAIDLSSPVAALSSQTLSATGITMLKCILHYTLLIIFPSVLHEFHNTMVFHVADGIWWMGHTHGRWSSRAKWLRNYYWWQVLFLLVFQALLKAYSFLKYFTGLPRWKIISPLYVFLVSLLIYILLSAEFHCKPRWSRLNVDLIYIPTSFHCRVQNSGVSHHTGSSWGVRVCHLIHTAYLKEFIMGHASFP